MKNNKIKLLIVFLSIFLLTGCAKTLTDENKKIVTYNSSIICEKCNTTCQEEESCIKNCATMCESSKKNETGQRLTKNILCRPTNNEVVKIYEIYGVDIDSLPVCSNFKLVSEYEGLWASLFVKPLAWLILKAGVMLKNYGLSLIIITLLIRCALMPLTKKTAMQSENINKAQPELDRITKKALNFLRSLITNSPFSKYAPNDNTALFTSSNLKLEQ